MLSTRQKAEILRKMGKAVPSTVVEGPPTAQWQITVESLFAGYAAERAARSLREAESARQLAQLRSELAAMPYPPAR